ncbi:unnamed protein product [Cyclocybe aegerita]|uniref:F-box domain-containing protein n=1 Tax=Cyclocybe aegerita TaxID=1973307 RepID=A0A8S0WZN5_CYCAE|nr:unnamed protein product [Cyclocybe aegerita]
MPIAVFPQRVPSELLNSILDDLESKSDLLALRTTCKVLHGVTTPRSFRVLDISRKKGGADAAISIFGVSELAQYVEEIILQASHGEYLIDATSDGGRSNFAEAPTSQEEEGDTVEDTASIFGHLSKLPNLRSLRLLFPNQYEDAEEYNEDEVPESEARKLQLEIIQAVATVTPVPSLKNFEIYNLVCLPIEINNSPGFKNFLKGLESVYVQVVLTSEESFYYYERLLDFYERDIPVFAQAPQETLTSLTLSSNVLNPGPVLESFWKETTMPNLHDLHFVRFAFHHNIMNPAPVDPTCLEWLVLRHAATLQSLKFTGCTIDMGQTVQGTWNVRSWNQVLKAFREKLTGLKEFILDPLPGRNEADPEEYNGYSWLLIESGYIQLFDVDDDRLPPLDADLAAYEELQQNIRKRLAVAA